MPLSLDPVTTVAQEFAAQVDAENAQAKLPAAADQIAQDWASSGSIGQQRDAIGPSQGGVGTSTGNSNLDRLAAGNVVPQQPPISFGPPAPPEPFTPTPGPNAYADVISQPDESTIQPDYNYQPPAQPFPSDSMFHRIDPFLQTTWPGGGGQLLQPSPYDRGTASPLNGMAQMNIPGALTMPAPNASRIATMAGPTPTPPIFSLGIPNAGLMLMPEQPTLISALQSLPGLSDEQKQGLVQASPYIRDQLSKGQSFGDVLTDILGTPHMDTLQAAAALANEPFRIAIESLKAIPTGGGTSLGQRVENAQAPVRMPAEFALGAAPYVGALAAAGATGGTSLAGLGELVGTGINAGAVLQVGAAADSYQRGEISANQAAVQIAPLIGGYAAGPILRAIAKGAAAAGVSAGEWLKTPAGQQALRFAQNERGGGPGEIPSEGNLPPPEQGRPGSFADMLQQAQQQSEGAVNALVERARAEGMSEREIAQSLRDMRAGLGLEKSTAETGAAAPAEPSAPASAGRMAGAPPPSEPLQARTGEPFSATLYRGESDLGPGTRAGVTPARGRFFTADPNTARGYAGQGGVIDETVTLNNPVVAAGREEAAQVLGVDTTNVHDIRRVDELLAQAARAQGHDGIIYPRLNEVQDLGAAGRGAPPSPAQPPIATAGAGSEPPIGGPPTTTGGAGGGELLPPVNQRFIAAMGDINKQLGQTTVAQRAAQVSAGRSIQAARISEALKSGGSASDIAAAVKNAPAGDILAEFPGIKGMMQPGDLEQLHQGWIDAATRGDITQFQAKQAQSIIDNMWQPPDGYKGPQPAQRTLLARIYGPEFVKAIPRTPQAWSIWKELRAAAGVPNTLLTSFSAHGPMNQMFRLGVTHPLQWLDATSKDLRALATHGNAMQLDNALRADPLVNGKGLPAHVPSADEAMHLYDLQNVEPTGQQPEGFTSAAATDTYIGRALNKIPGIQRSKEGFLTGLNAYKVNAYRNLVEKLQAAGDTNRDHYLLAGKWIDNGTGWTDVKIGDLASGVNAFFSPRNWLSKPLWLTTSAETMLKVPALRAEVARSLVGYAGAVTALMTVANLAGSKVGMGGDIDPFSSTFGQIRLGPARITPGRDYTPLIKLITQVASGRVDVSGRTFDKSRTAAVATFLRNAESPILGAATDVLTGKNVAGQTTNFTTPSGVRTELFNRLSPIFIRDIINAVREGGVKSAAFIGAPAFLGASTNTYTTPSEAMQAARDAWAKSAGYADYADASTKLGPNAAAAKAAKDAGVAAAQAEQRPSPFRDVQANFAAEQQQADAQYAQDHNANAWKDARTKIQAGQAAQLALLEQQNGGKLPSSGDPVLDGYYAVFGQFTNPKTGLTLDKQGLSQALDAYMSKLSPQDAARVDANTGLKGTPTEQAYRVAVKQLGDAGFFNQEKLGYASPYWQKQFAAAKTPLAKNGLMPDRFSSLGAMKAAYVQAYQNANPKTAPQIAAADAARQFERIGAVKQFRTQLNQHLQNFYKSNPALLRLATQWGFNTLSKAEEKILVPPRAPAAGTGTQ